MTKNFSNQGRDNMRPSSRNASSGRYSEEQSSRPARPRLSRDAVDRAWENGATRNHADYRPRQNAPRPPMQRSGRPTPGFQRGGQSPYERKPYENRQEGYGSPSSPPNRGEYRPQREQRPEMGQRRVNEPGHRAPGQPGLNSERWNRDTSPQQGGYRERNQDERPPRFTQNGPKAPQRPGYRNENGPRSFNRNENGPRSFAHNDRDPRPFNRSESGPRPFNRNEDSPRPFNPSESGPRPFNRSESSPRPFNRNDRGPRPFDRNDRGPRPFDRNNRNQRAGGPQRDSYNPRWQSRPSAQRDYSASQHEYPAPRRDYPGVPDERPGNAQFEGDYERFDTREWVERPERSFEKNVTRLPDGRVIKGSRPAQRKEARFWTGVEEESSTLLSQTPAEQQESVTPSLPPEKPATRPARPRKQPTEQTPKVTRKVKTVKTTRAASAEPKTGKKKARGPQGPVTRPSRKGYKWPTSEE